MTDHDDAIRAAIAAYHKRDVRAGEWVYGEARAIFAAGMRRAAEIADATPRQPDWPDRYDNGCSAVENAIRAAADKMEQA